MKHTEITRQNRVLVNRTSKIGVVEGVRNLSRKHKIVVIKKKVSSYLLRVSVSITFLFGVTVFL
jgi:hypothetical protein